MFTYVFSIVLVPFLCIYAAPGVDIDSQDGMRLVSQSSSFFTADFYEELRISERRRDQNLVFSPYSLSILLAMLKTGCRGETGKEINDALRLSGLNDSVILQGYQGMIRSLESSLNVTLVTANRIYVDDTFSLRSSYLKGLEDNFYSEAQKIDFAQTDAAASIINEWVAEQTKTKISEIIKPSNLNKDTKSMLVNAVYFNGKWENGFDPTRTETKNFTTIDNQVVAEEFMKMQGPMLRARIKEIEADALAIPYTGERLSLIVLLPLNASGFTKFEEKLRGYDLSGIYEKLKETSIILELPKLKLESTLDLVDEGLLEKMGIKTAFGKGDTKPDLSGMTENAEGLYVNSVVQKAFLEICEEGTTAAAAAQSATVLKILPHKFIVNRPFIAFIFDSETKSILFLFRKTK